MTGWSEAGCDVLCSGSSSLLGLFFGCRLSAQGSMSWVVSVDFGWALAGFSLGFGVLGLSCLGWSLADVSFVLDISLSGVWLSRLGFWLRYSVPAPPTLRIQTPPILEFSQEFREFLREVEKTGDKGEMKLSKALKTSPSSLNELVGKAESEGFVRLLK